MANLKPMQVVLQAATKVLRNKLKPESILPCLQQKGVLDEGDVQEITCEKTDAKKIITLLDKLHRKPESKYALFMEALEQVDKHLHKEVKDIEKKHNYKPPAVQSSYVDLPDGAPNQNLDQSGLSNSQELNENDIRIRTFTKWANTQLKSVNEDIDNLDKDFKQLEEDFWGGPKLTALIEVLLQKGKKDMDPDNQKAVMLTVMQQLILSFTTFGSKADASQTKESRRDQLLSSQTKESRRDQLLSWVKEQIPDYKLKITNLTSDWTDGKALGALVNKLAPGACDGWEKWEEIDSKRNIKEAMKIAEDWLQVAKVIKASDMQSGKADEICVMAYLAQFCLCTETEVPNGPKKPVVNEMNIGTTEMTVEWSHEPGQVIQEYQLEYVAGGPGGNWNKHVIPQSPCTMYTVKELEHYQKYGFSVRGLHGSKYGPISPLSDMAITTPILELENIKTILRKATEILCNFLDPSRVIDDMYEDHMLIQDDKHTIENKPAVREKVMTLLEMMQRKQAKAYFAFMSALRKERPDLFIEVFNLESDITKAKKLESDFRQPKAEEIPQQGDGVREAIVKDSASKSRSQDTTQEKLGEPSEDTQQAAESIPQISTGDSSKQILSKIPKKAEPEDIKIEMDLQGASVDRSKLTKTIFSRMLEPQILSNLVNNTFNPLGCILVKFLRSPDGSIQFIVQCGDVIVLTSTLQSIKDNTLNKQLERALLTKEVVGDTEDIKIKTKIDEAEYKQVEEKLVKFDRPGVPSTPNAVNIDKTSVKLTWSPPEANKESSEFKVKSYVIEKCDISKEVWFTVGKKVFETSCAIKNLTPGRQYQFRIRAVNVAGVGKESSPSDVITAKEPYDYLNAPRSPTARNIGAMKIEITWPPPPSDNGSPVTGYMVEKLDMKQKQWIKVQEKEITDTKLEVSEVTVGNQYQFRVAACNKGGVSDWSQPSVKIIPYDKPNAPSTPTVTNIDRKRIEITWSPPTSDNCSPVTGYIVEKLDIKQKQWIKVQEKEITDTKLIVSDVTAGNQYQFRVAACNKGGISDSSQPSVKIMPYDKPNAPNIPTVRNIGSRKIEITWLPSTSDNGSPVTGYIVEKLDMKHSRWTKVQEKEITDMKLIVNELTAGNQYQFRVAACNKGGISDWSQPSAIIPYDKPNAPSTPTVRNIGSKKIDITWSPPTSDNGSPVTGYIVEKLDIKQKQWTKVQEKEITDTRRIVSDVTAGNQYQFRVAASNKGGVSDSSQPSVKIIPYDKPNAPSTPTVTNVETKTIEITWSPPTSDNGSPVTGYIVEKLDMKQKQWIQVQEKEITDTTLIVSDVTAGNQYQFCVAACNKGGVSDSSQPSVKIIPYDKPNAPNIPTVRNIGSRKIEITWLPSSDNGSPVTGYIVEKLDMKHSRWTKVQEKEITDMKLIVSELTVGNQYQFRVAACNKGGISDWSQPSAMIILYDKPNAPSTPTVRNIDRKKIEITWLPPTSDNGSPVTGYIIEKWDIKQKQWTKVQEKCSL
ncbi:uncharacterized protein [Amphiura filiformis]|uniref:uncharacterized protein n=1 Tax=Amphiura filiformis TaxID=82378 RepID=UPI003B226DDF